MARRLGAITHAFGSDPIIVAYGVGEAAQGSANGVRGKAAEEWTAPRC